MPPKDAPEDVPRLGDVILASHVVNDPLERIPAGWALVLRATPVTHDSRESALAVLRDFDRRGATVWLSREAAGLVIDGLVAVIAQAKERKTANDASAGDLRAEWAEEVIRSLDPMRASLVPQETNDD